MDLFRLRTVALMVPSKVEKMPNAIKATISAKLPKAILGAKHVDKNPWENPRFSRLGNDLQIIEIHIYVSLS